MNRCTVKLGLSATRTKLLVLDGEDEILRAVLPAPKSVRNLRAATTLMEGLALWLDRALRVVVSADEEDGTWCLGLTDDLGIGKSGIFFSVEVIESRRRRPPKRLEGIGDFHDLKALVSRASSDR